VALDGKILRGMLGHAQPDQQPMHQLGLYETKTGLLLKEQVTGEKQNELSIVSQFLTPLWVKGRIISADALHTQRLFCTCVRRWEGHYVPIAKGNKGHAPRVLAVLNSFLLALLDFLDVSNVPQQMRSFDAQPWQTVRLLLGSLLTFK
jgi:hypothetical protein